MAENSRIEWTTHTFNTHWGCTKVSGGCKNCYADTFSTRFNDNLWGPSADRKPMAEKYWGQLDRWERKAIKEGVSPRIFCCSMSDLFEGPETCQNPAAYAVVTAARTRLFTAIDETPHLTYLLLTKRPENMVRFAPVNWADGWPAHVMAGTSVEDQAAADTRIPKLFEVPAQRFLSVEPLLGEVDLCDYLSPTGWLDRFPSEAGVDWVIVGGESGPGARPMHPDWVRSLRDQCEASGVPFLFKQWGNWYPLNAADETDNYPSARMTEWQDGLRSVNIDKHDAGRLLDRRTWDGMPQFDACKKGLDNEQHSRFRPV